MDENKEQNIPPEEEVEEDWRFAPPLAAVDEATITPDPEDSDHVAEAAAEAEETAPVERELPPITDALDIEAALAAVSSLDDMLAAEEAREQARLAREQAEAQTQQERRARLRSPELFFPMPAFSTLQRGRIDSVIPALALIGLGAWLMLTLTTSGQLPASHLLLLGFSTAAGLTLLSHWLASGRWAGGTLFFGLFILLTGGTLALLLASGLLAVGWPLLLSAPGVTLLLAGLLQKPNVGRLFFPGLVLVVAGIAGYAITADLLPTEVTAPLAALWPVVLVLVLLVLVLPALFRRRTRD